MRHPIVHHPSIRNIRHRNAIGFVHPNVNHQTVNHDIREREKEYYWIFAEANGRHIVWGCYSSYEEANRIAASKLSDEYEIVPLKTRDEATASRMLRARLLNESGDIGESFKRFKHGE